MAPTERELLAEIEGLASMQDRPLSWPETIQGFSRSYLAGPSYNFSENLEALVSSLFTDNTYDQELAQIRGEQARFKDRVDYLDNAVETASGAVLNPVGALKGVSALSKSTIPGVQTATKLVTSVPAQAALAGAGAADGENVLENALLSGAVGTGASALGTVLGRSLEATGRAADRMKLSAYNVGYADLAKQIKKMDGATFNDASQLPIVQTLNRAESQGIINAGNDLVKNAKNIAEYQKGLAKSIATVIAQADDVVPPDKTFGWNNTLNYIDSLQGTARDQAENAALKELEAITRQMKTGSLDELQKAKVGLNYKYDKNPYAEDVIKAIRSDLRQAIETRIDNAVKAKSLAPQFSGAVKQLNREFGDMQELRDAFMRRAPSDLKGNPVEDVIGGMRTSGGLGTANLASATTGNPIYAALGATLNAARGPEALSSAADVIRDPAIGVTLRSVGRALPEVVTGRNVAQVYSGMQADERAKQNRVDERALLAEIEQLARQSSGSGEGSEQLQQRSEKTTPTTANSLSSENPEQQAKDPKVDRISYSETDNLFNDLFEGADMRNVKDVEAEIDQDSYLSALYETESGRNPKAKNPKSTASGGFQFIRQTAKALELEDPFDLEQSLTAVRKLTDEHKRLFGDDPAVLYSAHYLGSPLLRKLQRGDALTVKEQEIVDGLLEKALPRFLRIYKKVAQRDTNNGGGQVQA